MVPAYLEELAVIPAMTSGKADRTKLPAPSGRRGLAGRQVYVAPATATETILAEALSEVLGLDRVSVDSHFFDDLGANSLLTAHFCARARKRAELPPLAIQDVYLHPTVRDLAAALQEAAPADRSEPAEPADPVARVGTAQYVLCGALQILILLGVVCAGSLVLAAGLRWVSAATDAIALYLRSAAFGAAMSKNVSAPDAFSVVICESTLGSVGSYVAVSTIIFALASPSPSSNPSRKSLPKSSFW